MFSFALERTRRKPSLTPMIDVVFLLLVFFMLASRFGLDTRILLNVAGQQGTQASYSGPPRLVDLTVDGYLLNGVGMAQNTVIDRLADLTETPEDTVILRSGEGVKLQEVVDAIEMLSAAGFFNLVLVE